MMRELIVVILMGLVWAGTCPVFAEPQAVPDLTGNWTGTSTGHDRVAGYDGPPSWQLFMSVVDQRDRAFNGTISYKNSNNPDKSGSTGFSGVIGPDMKTVYLAEYTTNGFVIGEIIDSDTMEFIYLESGDDASAAIDTFTRETLTT